MRRKEIENHRDSEYAKQENEMLQGKEKTSMKIRQYIYISKSRLTNYWIIINRRLGKG